jgi:4'-phosphopantetheinyl transferase
MLSPSRPRSPYRIAFCPREEAEAELRASASRWLSSAEAAVIERFPAEKRRLDWLAARIAAKRGTKLLLEEEAGPSLDAREIEVGNDSAGRPFLRLPPGSPPPPAVSLSHSASGGLCALSRRRAIGADWEVVAPRAREVLEQYAHARERTAGFEESPEAQTRLWALKEAVLKLLGLGLSCDPMRVIIPPAGEGPRSAELCGFALSRGETLRRTAVSLEDWAENGSAIAVAYGD